MNLQPSEAEAGFDIRVPPTADPEALERRIAEEWAPVSRNMTYQVLINSLKKHLISLVVLHVEKKKKKKRGETEFLCSCLATNDSFCIEMH